MTIKLVKKTFSIKQNMIQLFKAESCYIDKAETILFIGVFHGDEPEGEHLILNLINEINKNSELIKNNIILFIPVLNPDGKELKTRGNANGVDLNRNFPTKNWLLSSNKDAYFSGTSPASEIETKFLIEIIQEYKPHKIITLHTPYKIVNYDGPAKKLAKKISELNGYPIQKDIGYATPGSFGTYYGMERNIPVITLELPENIDINTLWEENKTAFFYIISSSNQIEKHNKNNPLV
ncbi:MAG: M14 family murein peptide amidase A [bacterium]